mgnify:CR=1 FL=1
MIVRLQLQQAPQVVDVGHVVEKHDFGSGVPWIVLQFDLQPEVPPGLGFDMALHSFAPGCGLLQHRLQGQPVRFRQREQCLPQQAVRPAGCGRVQQASCGGTETPRLSLLVDEEGGQSELLQNDGDVVPRPLHIHQFRGELVLGALVSTIVFVLLKYLVAGPLEEGGLLVIGCCALLDQQETAGTVSQRHGMKVPGLLGRGLLAPKP